MRKVPEIGIHWRFNNSTNDLGELAAAEDLARQLVFPRQVLRGVAADLCLVVAQAQAGKILREAFVKPVLCRRIVEIKKQTGKLARDCAPAILGGQIENDVIAIVAGYEKAGRGYRLPLPKGATRR